MRKRVFDVLELMSSENRLSHAVAGFIIALIALNVASVVLETEKVLWTAYKHLFRAFEVFSVAVFTAEYVLRVWACTSDKRFRSPVAGRMRYVVTPLALIDLIAILPFYLPMLIGVDLRFVRVFRLMRLFRLLKVTRYCPAFNVMGRVLRAKREELLITLVAVLTLLLFASCVMYLAEHDAQPKAFSSVPAAMWWGVVTLTTVGYGDIYPVTVLGKCCAAVIALLSIGLFALPAGILASGFVEVLRESREMRWVCPHCGGVIDESSRQPERASCEESGGL